MLKIKTDHVEAIIKEVAQSVIVPRFRNLHSHEVHFKGEDDPVTIADQEAEALYTEKLLKLLPDSLVVGEEAYAADPSILKAFDQELPVWVVDPLDGTKAFLAGAPVYGVIVALTQGNETLAAWLYDPTSDEFITAEKGAGAYHKGRRLHVLPPDHLDNMSGIIGARIACAYQECANAPTDRKPVFHRMLSACHDYARLVVDTPHFSGTTTQAHFHCWLQTCTPWDSAAGVFINAEAGGYTAHWNGEAFKPSHYGRGLLTAPNAESWQEISQWVSTFCPLPNK